MKRLACILALLAISGCEWTNRQVDGIHDYMSGVDKVCDHWQCVSFWKENGPDPAKAVPVVPVSSHALPPADEPLPDDTLRDVPDPLPQ